MHFPFETTETVLGRIVRSCIEKNMFYSGLSYRLILFSFVFVFHLVVVVFICSLYFLLISLMCIL